MKIMIAGAGGQLGRSLQSLLESTDLLALSRQDMDVIDLDAVRAQVSTNRPDIVINCSAFNDVDGAESDHESAYRSNAVGPRNLALAAAECDARVLHVSTDYVFDGLSSRPYHEYDRPNPLSVYGKSKLAGERAVIAANPRHFIVRTSWLYHEEGRNFPNTILGLAKSQELRVVNDQVGSPTYAPHLAEAILRLIETEAYGTYHLAGRGGTSWYELTRTLLRELAINAPVVPVSTVEYPRPAPRPRHSALTTIQEPRILLPSWKQGVKDFAAAIKNRS